MSWRGSLARLGVGCRSRCHRSCTRPRIGLRRARVGHRAAGGGALSVPPGRATRPSGQPGWGYRDSTAGPPGGVVDERGDPRRVGHSGGDSRRAERVTAGGEVIVKRAQRVVDAGEFVEQSGWIALPGRAVGELEDGEVVAALVVVDLREQDLRVLEAGSRGYVLDAVGCAGVADGHGPND